MREIDYISEERLKTFERHTDNRERAIALHNHTLQLGSSLMSMIALFELSLRNGTNHQLARYFGETDWMLPGNSTVPLKKFERDTIQRATQLARKATYSKLSHKEKSHLDVFAFPGGVPIGASHETRVRARQKLFVVSHGQIISQTTLSFWKRLYSPEYDNDLWKTSLKRVFPDKRLKRSHISSSLEVVYSTRNRVAHHEPVYGDRLEEAMKGLEFLRNALGARKIGEETTFKRFSRVQYLRLRMDYEGFLAAWRTLTKC